MPRPNPQRREHLVGAAIAVLAEKGSRGLTHRAVDAAAGAPDGTASRYFRTRDALMDAIIQRIGRRLSERVDAHVVRPLDPARLEETLVKVLTLMVADERGEPLALFELHLESTRNPALRSMLADALRERCDLIVRQCRAAGIALTEQDAMLLETSVLGILFTALTTGVPDDPGPAIRAVARTVLDRYVRA
ncbi:TetR family transcriptional regulator [Nonomuraea sp. KC401]|uniref:TetR/AcrR family transcriptional regulator n=1 Tax=unclassified Nonomuraea TaxID=2593643 RepID=UPI0010FE9888|nr:TetR family transcriptional regulator [Nonomuraea sp. KC401]NBE96857.1 TetR family transcriptional regulator [Nonomuraea sp. K271]TLF66477.1 TetR family transcriptional regulator [Nonomuraea sp. KC401]